MHLHDLEDEEFWPAATVANKVRCLPLKRPLVKNKGLFTTMLQPLLVVYIFSFLLIFLGTFKIWWKDVDLIYELFCARDSQRW